VDDACTALAACMAESGGGGARHNGRQVQATTPSPSTTRLPHFVASKRRHRRLFTPEDSTLSQIEADAGHFAGHRRRTSPANIGSYSVNGARRRYPDLAHKGTATVSIAAHAPLPVIDKGAGNPIKVRLGLQGEPRPIGRKCAAGTTSPAYQARLRRHPGCVRRHRRKPRHRKRPAPPIPVTQKPPRGGRLR
jgi:hypothetical protein